METFNQITQIFNNRELSVFCWIIIFLIIALRQKTIRKPALVFIRKFTEFRILSIFLSMIVYIGFFITILYFLKIWDFSFLKDTIYWTFGIAFIILFNINDLIDNKGRFRKIFLSNLKLIVIIEFITNLYVFKFYIEMITFPILIFLTLTRAFVERKEEDRIVKNLLDTIIAIYGLSVIVFSIIHVAKDFENFASINNLKSILLSPTLTTIYLPYIYFAAVKMSYESFYASIKWILKENKKLYKFTRWITFRKCGLNLSKVRLVTKKIHIYSSEDKSSIVKDLNMILKK